MHPYILAVHDAALAVLAAILLYETGLKEGMAFLAGVLLLVCAGITLYVRVQQAKTAKAMRRLAEEQLRLSLASSE